MLTIRRWNRRSAAACTSGQRAVHDALDRGSRPRAPASGTGSCCERPPARAAPASASSPTSCTSSRRRWCATSTGSKPTVYVERRGRSRRPASSPRVRHAGRAARLAELQKVAEVHRRRAAVAPDRRRDRSPRETPHAHPRTLRDRRRERRPTVAATLTFTTDEVIRTEALTKVYPGDDPRRRRARPLGARRRDLRAARSERRRARPPPRACSPPA